MQFDYQQQLFQSYLPGVEWIKISSIESEVLFWEDWFLGCYWIPLEPHKLRVQFKFNWNTAELSIFKKAEAMGLLPFHFYQTIVQRLEEESISLIQWTDPNILSQFLIIDQNLDQLLSTFDKVKKRNVIITETALLSLRKITDKYALESQGEN